MTRRNVFWETNNFRNSGKPKANMARRAEQRKRAKPPCKFHLFNCDGTCRLEPVDSLLRAVEKKVDFKITIKKHSQNTAQLLKIIPELKMDYAVFVVHARDSSRSFNDDSNGKIYNALKKRTGSGWSSLISIYLAFLTLHPTIN